MNDFTMYELAHQRRDDLISESRRSAQARVARGLRPKQRRGWSGRRQGFALLLRRMADRVEPSRTAHPLALPAQRHLAR